MPLQIAISELLVNDFDIDFSTAESLQRKWGSQVRHYEEKFGLLVDQEKVQIIAAVDVAYHRLNNADIGYAAAIVWDCKKNTEIDHSYAKKIIAVPYKAGFLGFREIPLMVEALKQLEQVPDLIFCDGYGKIHPYEFGEATHFGMLLNIPTAGIAKTKFIGKLENKEIMKVKGEFRKIYQDNHFKMNNENKEDENTGLGEEICLASNNKPAFISCGYRCSLELVQAIALKFTFNSQQPIFLEKAHSYAEGLRNSDLKMKDNSK